MLLKNKVSHRALVRMAMSCLLLFFGLEVVARLLPPAAPFWLDVLDGVRGAALGVTLGLMFFVLRIRHPAP